MIRIVEMEANRNPLKMFFYWVTCEGIEILLNLGIIHLKASV